MKCYNINDSAFKALLDEYGGDYFKASYIADLWQKANESDEIPTVQQANVLWNSLDAFGKSNAADVKNSVFQNLSNLGWISNFVDALGRFKIIGDTIEKVTKNASHVVKYLNYLGFNDSNFKFEVVRNKDVAEFYVELDADSISYDQVQKIRSINNSRHVDYIIPALQKLFPQVDIQYLSEEEASILYMNIPAKERKNVPFEKVKSFYYNGQAILIQDRVNKDVAIEEVLHPFTDVLRKDNRKLYNSLVAEAKEMFPDIDKSVNENYTKEDGFSQEDRDIEILTKSLTKLFSLEKPKDKEKSMIDRFKEWFGSIIEKIGKFIVGNKYSISPERLKETTRLSEVASLLSTGKLFFDPFKIQKPSIRFALNNYLETGYQRIYAGAKEQIQRDFLTKALQLVQSDSNVEASQFAFNKAKAADTYVVLDDATHTYMDVNNPGKKFLSSTSIWRDPTRSISGENKVNVDVGNDMDAIMEGVIMGYKLDEILANHTLAAMTRKDALEIYRAFEEEIRKLKEQGAVLIPQVIVYYDNPNPNYYPTSDGANSIAGAIDVLAIMPDGTFKIIDLKSSIRSFEGNEYNKVWQIFNSILGQLTGARGLGNAALSTKNKHSLQVNMYARMLEEMGYVRSTDDDSARTFHVKVEYDGTGANKKYKGFKIEGFNNHYLSENEVILDIIMPRTKAQNFGSPVGSPVTPEEMLAMYQGSEYQNYSFSVPEGLNQEVARAILSLNNFNINLGKAKKVLKTVRKGITQEGDIDDEIKRLDALSALSLLGIESGGSQALRSLSEILVAVNKEIQELERYISDKKNYSDPKFAEVFSNFEAYYARFKPLFDPELAIVSGPARRKLMDQIQVRLNRLNADADVPGSIKYIMADYLANKVKETDGRELTDSEAKELVEKGVDITNPDMLFGNANFSSDALTVYARKIYNNARQKSISMVEEIQTRLNTVRSNLIDLAGTKDPRKLYEFMYELDKDGNPLKYIEPIGPKYFEKRDRLLEDLDGAEYIPYTQDNVQDDEIKKHNLEVRKKKAALRAFRNPESQDAFGNPIDGEYHRYSSEFKIERDKYMMYVPSTDPDKNGYWIYKPTTSQVDQLRFRRKYYTVIPNFKSCNEEGIITERDIEVVKEEYVERREITSKGEDMRSEKYRKMIQEADPSNAGAAGYKLAVARYEFYKEFMNLYSKAIEMIGEDQTQDLMGKMINVRSTFAKKVTDKPSILARILGSAKSVISGIKVMFRSDIEFSRYVEDEKGEVRNTIPIMYTGSFKNEAAIQKLKDRRRISLNKIQKLERSKDIFEAEIKRRRLENKDYTSIEAKLVRVKNKLDQEKLVDKDLSIAIIAEDSKNERKDVSMDSADSLMKFLAMAANYKHMNDIEDTLLSVRTQIEKRETVSADVNSSRPIKVLGSVVNKLVNKNKKNGNNLLTQFDSFLNNNLYGLNLTRKTTGVKIILLLRTINSLRLMGLNPFVSVDNLMQGMVENMVEGAAGKHVSGPSLRRAAGELLKSQFSNIIQKTTNLKNSVLNEKHMIIPTTKYEAVVEYFRMLDQKSDLRELSGAYEGAGNRFNYLSGNNIMNIMYSMQDAGEYAVQSIAGVAVIMDTHVVDTTTGKTLNLYDAIKFDRRTGKIDIDPKYKAIKYTENKPPKLSLIADSISKINKKEFDKYIVTSDIDDDFRYNTRQKIRNLNILLQGSYALEDKTVAENYLAGMLAMQFHRWVWEAGIQKYFSKRRYNATLGWTEGRFVTGYAYLGYLTKKFGLTKKGDFDNNDYSSFLTYSGYTGLGGKNDEMAIAIVKNLHRTQASILSQLLLFSLKSLAVMIKNEIFEEEEDDLTDNQKRWLNMLTYRIDKLYKEQTTFSVNIGRNAYDMARGIFPTSAMFKELSEVIVTGLATGYVETQYRLGRIDEEDYLENKNVFYQRGIRDGESKLSKEFGDLFPIIHAMQTWRDYINQDEFYRSK